ncbi:MAG: indolepyruvate oxidoreductase subunit beta family protein [Alphaproteobacteria bacterium]|jgi:indolepyruvate ferredoxin oxidoreductase beta subunit|nr:indolepyruvate oxidoreductase subunit beta family protein [Alphaproteobacteria bacterium]
MPEAAEKTSAGTRPISILIAALGGEGGGVLTSWIVEAATRAGYPVQSTSIPGVAQRTGATTYYLEVHPQPRTALNGGEPVMTLTPGPGDIDLMVASEILEAGRALENGYISPERTTLIASTHRVYAIAEKSAMADGRFDAPTVLKAAEQLSERAILLNFGALALESGSVVNAVLLGAVAASGKLPFEDSHLEDAIRGSGIAVEASLNGFRLGRDKALAPPAKPVVSEPATEAAERLARLPALKPLIDRLEALLPAGSSEVPLAGLIKVVDFQDLAYGRLYLDRLERLLAAPGKGGKAATTNFVATSARGLANWMAYDDVVRVADLRTRAERFARVRREVGAKTGEPVQIVDYFKPGLEEFCAVLPAALAGPLLAWAERTGRLNRWHIGLHVRTSSLPGFLMLRLLAGLRRFRRFGHRYRAEQPAIEAWLGTLIEAKAESVALAAEIADCTRLIRGYGETHHRGRGNFDRILDGVARPGLAGGAKPRGLAAAVRQAREAALADPEGRALDEAIAAE